VISASLISLIANPMQFHGKRVTIIGYARIQFEGNAVYLHQTDYEHAIHRNALWLYIPRADIEQRRPCHDRYCSITGVFDAKSTGHGNLYGGGLRDIEYMEVWKGRSE